MLTVLFTSEYELFGNGRGCARQHMVAPTARMFALLDEFGAKLTLHAEVAEILRFADYLDQTGDDAYHYKAIVEQLQCAVRTGHDVQLHLHASYCNARHRDGYWQQDYSELDLAQLPLERQRELIARCKGFLQDTLRVARPDYRCFAFRASNWSMQPSGNIQRALVENGITLDTSVWKYGRFRRPVQFDYRSAQSALVPWPADEQEICRLDPEGKLLEVPIYSELQPAWRFLSPHRVYRAIDRRFNPLWKDPELEAHLTGGRARPDPESPGLSDRLRALFARYPMKMDFNQCTGRQLLAGLRRAERRYGHLGLDLPFVVFGHSRSFTSANAASLRPLLRTVAEQGDRYRFGLFSDLPLADYRRFWGSPEAARVPREDATS